MQHVFANGKPVVGYRAAARSTVCGQKKAAPGATSRSRKGAGLRRSVSRDHRAAHVEAVLSLQESPVDVGAVGIVPRGYPARDRIGPVQRLHHVMKPPIASQRHHIAISLANSALRLLARVLRALRMRKIRPVAT